MNTPGQRNHATSSIGLSIAALSIGLFVPHPRAAAEERRVGLEMVRRYERVERPGRPMAGPAAQLAEAFVHSWEETLAAAGGAEPAPPS